MIINNGSVLLTVLEAGKFKIKVSVWWCSDEDPPPHGLLLMVSSHGRRSESILGSLFKGTNAFDEGSHFPEAPPLNIITLGV